MDYDKNSSQIKNFILGIFFSIIGIFFVIYSLNYKIGSLSNMEPGFFPLVVSAVLMIVGIFLIIKNFKWTS